MQKWLIKILVCAVNVFVITYLMDFFIPKSVYIRDMFSALIVAVILSFLDAIVKPLLILLTLPATILTLGLFLFVINACIILIDDHFVGGFKVESFWYALLFSILLSFFNSFVHKKAFPEEKKQKVDQ
jgi:putative membrane protein